MPRILTAVSLFFLVLIAIPSFAQQTAFDRLKNRFEQGEIFMAEFVHTYEDSYTGDSTSSKGTIWVGRDKYKVRAQNQSVVVDGETSMVFDGNRNRVIISTYEPAEDDFAPSRILNGADSTYVIESQERRDGKVFITLSSEDPFAVFKRVEIALSPELIPLSIFAVDQADNRITTTFENGSFVPLEEGMFHLDYPEGAEIVDMRN